MGQKIIVNSLHLIKNKNWNSIWYGDYNNYMSIFQEDLYIYLYIRAQSKLKYNVLKRKHLYQIEIIKSFIYRTKKSMILNLQLVYLKKKNLNKRNIQYFIKTLLVRLKKLFYYKNNRLLISYKVGKNTALFMALRIGTLLEKRVRFQSRAVEKLIKQVDCSGVRVKCKGRLNFIDRARNDQISFGSVPLQTTKANIDYGLVIANTKKGLQSVKVWLFTSAKV